MSLITFDEYCKVLGEEPRFFNPRINELREGYIEQYPESLMAKQYRWHKEWVRKNSFVTVKPEHTLAAEEAALFKRKQEFYKKTLGVTMRYVKIVPKTAGALRLKRDKKGEK